MYILKNNLERLNNGMEVVAHKLKLNNVHSYTFVEPDRLSIRKTNYSNMYMVSLNR